MRRKACVVGAGPNGLAAAIVLKWIRSPVALAHPLDDGTAILLEHDLADMSVSLGVDGAAWDKLMRPFVERWTEFSSEVLAPVNLIPRYPWLMARFGMLAFQPASTLACRFRSHRTRALFAGLAAHSFLSLDEPLSGAFAMMMAVPAHVVGWPFPRGGAQSLTNALCRFLSTFPAKINTSTRVENLAALKDYDLVICDLTPRQLATVGTQKLSVGYRRQLGKFRYGSAVFKVDFALDGPIPWKASECLRAATVHLGGTFEEIAESEKMVRLGQQAGSPFVLLAQHSLFDSSRAPAGKHTAWAYCHVPNGSNVNMLQKIEDQIERFAPGFRQRILARRTFSPSDLENMDANLVGGDISGGAMDIRQFLFRPTWRRYATSAPDIYICSSSTPPGGGVHGMCGYHAARMALRKFQK
jgi:phytoene dehydrogenase-like protein